MFVLVLASALACASAAPYHHYGPDPFHSPFRRAFDFESSYEHHPSPSMDRQLEDYYNQRESGTFFDTAKFWTDLSRQLLESQMQLEKMFNDFKKDFPMTKVSREEIINNEYIITMEITGARESDIRVKARQGLMIIQAFYTCDKDSNTQAEYLDIRNLPMNVDPSGSWTYKDGILKITFPINQPLTTTTLEPEASTFAPDIGEPKIDFSENINIEMNNEDDTEQVEATTYSVDVKDEVELLPGSRY